MSTFLFLCVYFSGFAISFILCMVCGFMAFKKIDDCTLIMSIVISIFSWVAVASMLFNVVIEAIEDRYSDNTNLKTTKWLNKKFKKDEKE